MREGSPGARGGKKGRPRSTPATLPLKELPGADLQGLPPAGGLTKEDLLRTQVLLLLARQTRLTRLIGELEAAGAPGRERLAAEETLTRLQGRMQQALGLWQRMEREERSLRLQEERLARKGRPTAYEGELAEETARDLERLLANPGPPRTLEP